MIFFDVTVMFIRLFSRKNKIIITVTTIVFRFDSFSSFLYSIVTMHNIVFTL